MSINDIIKRGESAEEGFTLIELVIVVAILGVLLAIGIPTFGQVQSHANKTAMEGNSESLYKSWLAAYVERGGSPVTGGSATSFNDALAVDVAAEVTRNWREENGYDHRWAVSYMVQSDYNSEDINVCFDTSNNDDGPFISRSAGHGNCEDFG